MVGVCGAGRDRDDAAGTRDGAGAVFELDGGVVDLEVVAQDVIEPVQDGVALGRRHVVDQDVAAKGAGIGADVPDMEVVDVQDAGNEAHGRGDFAEIEPAGEAFKQNIERFADDVPGAPNDETGDGQGEDGIDLGPAPDVDDEGTDDDGDRAEKVAQHVDEGTADIEIVLAGAIEAEHDPAVEGDTESGDPEHDEIVNRQRVQQAQGALVDHPNGEQDERKGVDERREDAGAVVAKGLLFVGGFVLQVDGEPRKQKGEGIGGVMAGVRDQREAVGADTEDQFERDKGGGGEQRPD